MEWLKAFGNSGKEKKYNKLENYKNGKFQNIHATPSLTEDYSMFGVLFELFKKHKDKFPNKTIPFIKNDLFHLDKHKDCLIWFGHSSYFMQLKGKTILVDPVFSGFASPFSLMVKSFQGSNNYQVEDLPYIDFLFITHEHWDHLDYQSIEKLKTKTGKVICGLGVGHHFEFWGWDTSKIIERNWNESVDIGSDFTITFCPGRHFSGRGLKRNVSLWTSFILASSSYRFFLGGDSGYDSHFKEIGQRFGPFDLAILECGQYDKRWSYIHMQPEQTLQAAKDLQAKYLLPVHNSKFALANHAWHEPLEKISALAENDNFPILTPMIGEIVYFTNLGHYNNSWWKSV